MGDVLLPGDGYIVPCSSFCVCRNNGLIFSRHRRLYYCGRMLQIPDCCCFCLSKLASSLHFISNHVLASCSRLENSFLQLKFLRRNGVHFTLYIQTKWDQSIELLPIKQKKKYREGYIGSHILCFFPSIFVCCFSVILYSSSQLINDHSCKPERYTQFHCPLLRI